MDYIITIPSYKRALQLQKKTLTCLNEMNIPKMLINIFVVEEEYDEYLTLLDKSLYNNLIIGEKGLVNQREFIQQYYPIGTHIISLDDDIECIDLSLTEYTDLDSFFKDAFKKCIEKNIFLWSVYPVYNIFFRKDRKPITEGLNYCIGALYGFINRYEQDLIITLTREGNKEDVERSILYFLKDGKTLRFNKIGFKTKYYGIGGLGGLKERLEKMKTYSILINEKYNNLTKIKIRKNGLYEITFKEQKQPKQQTINDNNPYLKQLKEIEASRDDIQEIYAMLEDITIPLNTNKTGRARSFGSHRAMTLGMIKGRVSKKYDISCCSKKFPELYEKILKFGKTFVPFDFTSIHVNHNVVCPRHLDPYNTGPSCIISIGDYKGCNLVVESYGEYDTNCKPLIFDGSKLYHYNTQLISGNKYSFVFFNNTH